MPIARMRLWRRPPDVPPVECDCTVHCGDDPRLATGQAYPCVAKLRRDRMAARHARADQMRRELGCEDWLAAMEELTDLRRRMAVRESLRGR